MMSAWLLPLCDPSPSGQFLQLSHLVTTTTPMGSVAAAASLFVDSLPTWLQGLLPSLSDGQAMVALAVCMFSIGALLLVGAFRRSRREAPAESIEPEIPEEPAPPPRPARPSGLRARPLGGGGQAATAHSNEPMGSDDDGPMPETKIESTLFSMAPTREILGWIVFQDEKGTRVPISLRSLRIGRHPDNDIQLDNRTVHRFHATMQLDDDGAFTITDVGTINKVFVNRKAHQEVALKNGDLVQLGEVRFRFYAGSSGPAPFPSSAASRST